MSVQFHAINNPRLWKMVWPRLTKNFLFFLNLILSQNVWLSPSDLFTEVKSESCFSRLLLDRKSFCNFSYHHLVAFKQNASLRHFYIGFIFLTWKLRPCFLLFIELETRWLSNHSCCTTLSTYSGTHGVKCIVLLSLCNAKAEPTQTCKV